jgi:hypothetical protein
MDIATIGNPWLAWFADRGGVTPSQSFCCKTARPERYVMTSHHFPRFHGGSICNWVRTLGSGSEPAYKPST